MPVRPRVLILNPTCLDVLDDQRDELARHEVDWVAEAGLRNLQPDQVDRVLEGVRGLILPAVLRNLPTAEQMDRHPSLQVLSIAASGYDWLDLAAATRHGIVVSISTPPEGSEVVAELTLALMLAAARQIPHHDALIRSGHTRRGMGVMLWGKTLGIVGLGRIGKAVARRARGFDMPILATDPNADRAFTERYGIEVVPLADLLRRSDVVTLHVRLSAETHGLIGRQELGLMKPTAWLINAARAELVDERALAEAIVAGRLAGAGLDDPPSDPRTPLLDSPRVVFTPHLGNRAVEGMCAVFRDAIRHAVDVLEGRVPDNVLNPEVYEGRLRAPRPQRGVS